MEVEVAGSRLLQCHGSLVLRRQAGAGQSIQFLSVHSGEMGLAKGAEVDFGSQLLGFFGAIGSL